MEYLFPLPSVLPLVRAVVPLVLVLPVRFVLLRRAVQRDPVVLSLERKIEVGLRIITMKVTKFGHRIAGVCHLVFVALLDIEGRQPTDHDCGSPLNGFDS